METRKGGKEGERAEEREEEEKLRSEKNNKLKQIVRCRRCLSAHKSNRSSARNYIYMSAARQGRENLPFFVHSRELRHDCWLRPVSERNVPAFIFRRCRFAPTARSRNKTDRLCGHKLIKIFSLHRYKLICLAAAGRERERDKRASEKITPEGREIYGFVTRLIAELFAPKA